MESRLPVEINHLIYSFLPTKDLLNLAGTSNNNYELISSPLLWKKLVKRDFCININDNHKEFYKQSRLGISREKDRFIFYMTILNIMILDITLKENNGAFKSQYDDNMDEQQRQNREDYRKQNAIEELFKQLDKSLMGSQKSFENIYYKLVQSVTAIKLTEIKEASIEFFNLLISGSLKFDINLLSNENINENEKANISLFVMGFQALCKLDASISIGILLNKMELNINSTFIMEAFGYPCVKVINKLFEYHIDVNKIFWLVNGSDRMHITPLMSAVICMIDKKHMNSSKEIILLLLQNGANTEIPVFITDDDWSSDEEYNQRCKPIYEMCSWLLENNIQIFDDIKDKRIFSETMEMIINHRNEIRLISRA